VICNIEIGKGDVLNSLIKGEYLTREGSIKGSSWRQAREATRQDQEKATLIWNGKLERTRKNYWDCHPHLKGKDGTRRPQNLFTREREGNC